MQVIIFASRAILLLVLLVALKFRFAHPGRVCSGDYLEASDAPQGYLIEQGFFLKLHVFLLSALFISLLVCGCFEAIIARNRNTRANLS